MSNIDINRVINGTPQKVLLNAFDALKKDYNEKNASEYKSLYANKPISFILDNSEYIFTEPYYGLPFYADIIINHPENCVFLRLVNELDKISRYIESHENMPETQKNLYLDLRSKLSKFLNDSKNIRVYASYINNHISDSFEKTLSDLICNYRNGNEDCKDEISNLLMNADPICIETYLPFIVSACNGNYTGNCIDKLIDIVNVCKDNAKEKWGGCTKAILCAHKLLDDPMYKSALLKMENPTHRKVIEFIGSVNLDDCIDDLSTVKVKDSDVLFHKPVNAVNSLFDDIYQRQVLPDKEPDVNINSLKKSVLEESAKILTEEYQIETDLHEVASKYPFVKEGSTIDEAFHVYSEMLLDIDPEAFDFMEAVDDVSDDDIDDIESYINKKPVDPSNNQSKALKTQNKFMDREVEQLRKKAIKTQKREERSNARRAITNLPKNVAVDIQDQVKKLDEADDDRRKKFMTEPGFRKKWFRNLKLAILYGSAATVKLSLIPVVMMCRHFSKVKDIRIRNELVRELETEIKVTEEKINDASANEDKAEKYRLMRIRDKLNAEMVRVRMNSKYV